MSEHLKNIKSLKKVDLKQQLKSEVTELNEQIKEAEDYISAIENQKPHIITYKTIVEIVDDVLESERSQLEELKDIVREMNEIISNPIKFAEYEASLSKKKKK